MTKANRSPDDARTIKLVVEELRLLGYGGFWVVVVVGILLTRFVTKLDMEGTALMAVFGYNNICVYFDYAPSNSVLPILWAFTLVLLLTYITAHWLQMRGEVAQGLLTRGVYRILTGLTIFEAITLIVFSNIFAVSPHTEPDATLWIHTIPFFMLQFGMVSLAVSNTLHGIRSGYWDRLGLPGWFSKAAIVYCVLFALVVGFKIPVAVNAMLIATTDLQWFAQTASLETIAGYVDRLFLFFAAFVPMAKALYLVMTKGDELEVVYLRTMVASATP